MSEASYDGCNNAHCECQGVGTARGMMRIGLSDSAKAFVMLSNPNMTLSNRLTVLCDAASRHLSSPW